MKKYHHSPMFGVKSGMSNCTPYVEERNSQDPPARALEMYNSHANPAPKIAVCFAEYNQIDDGALPSCAFRSWQSSMRGTSRRAGYIEKYEARLNASMELIGLFETPFAIAKRMAQLVKTLVGRPIQVAMVRGLYKNLNVQ